MTALGFAQRLNGPGESPAALDETGVKTLADLRAQSAGYARLIRSAGARAIALRLSDGFLLLAAILGGAGAGARLIFPGPETPSDQWDLLLDDAAPIPAAMPSEPAPKFGADAVEMVFYTSGTTAAPKQIRRRLEQFEREAAILEAMWGGPDLGAHLGTTPHQHVYGLSYKIIWAFCAGRPFYSRSRDMWEDVLQDLSDNSVLITSPAHLKRTGGLTTKVVPGLIVSAGAPLPAGAAQETRDLFRCAPREIYGSSETGSIARRDMDQDLWTPLPEVTVSTGPDGLLQIRSPWIDGDFDGSDAVEMVGDRFRLLGRADRVVKIEGKRVGLAAVEAALNALPEVADNAVAALGRQRDELAAAVVLTQAGQARLEQIGPFRMGRSLRAALGDSVEIMAKPRRWRFVDRLPTDSMGKRRDRDLTALFDMPAPPKFPHIVDAQTQPDQAVLTLDIPADLFWFQGHFPELPLLPGVVQLDWALTYADHYLNTGTTAAVDFQVKYKGAIFPNDRIVLTLTRQPEKKRLSFEYKRGEDLCSNGRINLP